MRNADRLRMEYLEIIENSKGRRKRSEKEINNVDEFVSGKEKKVK